MDETGLRNRDQNDGNNETGNKRAKLFTERGTESRSEPGAVRWTYAVFKHPPSTKPPVSFEDSHRGFNKYLLRKPRHATCPLPPISAKNFNCGQGPPIDLNDEHDSHLANLFASEAVKEYNNREFEDKLELVKVTDTIVFTVAGYRYDLTFDAKVLAEGGGGTTKTYFATVWLKYDGSLQVTSFKLTDDGQGKEVVFWKRR